MTQTLFERYLAPARRHSAIWRLAAGLLLSGLVYLVWLSAMFAALRLIAGPDGARAWGGALLAPDRPWPALLLLGSFLGMAAGPVLAVRLLHRRTAATLLGPRRRLLRHFALAAALVLAVAAVPLGTWMLVYDPVPNLPVAIWLAFLPLAVPGVLLQTLAEELVFRGYLLQQLAVRFGWRLAWMVAPSLLFGALHYDAAADPALTWLLMGGAALFGILAADLTAATGSLGAAWGFHFANNVVALLILATRDTITGLALWTTPYGTADAPDLFWLVSIDAGAMLGAWALLRRVLRR
jgi:membrane protease YdiL (CAAX protease family)